MDTGLIIAADGQRVKDKDNVYDSRNPKLQVSLVADPPHIARVPVVGTAIVANAGNGYDVTETLLSVKHNLGYKPKCLVFFYVQSSSIANKAGLYSGERFIYQAGAFEDAVYWDADEQWFYIKHRIYDFLGLTNRTSTADQYDIRVKYMICSNKYQAE